MSCFSPSLLIIFCPVSFSESFYHNFESMETVSLDLILSNLAFLISFVAELSELC